MAKIESKTVAVKADSATIRTFLSDLNNLEQLMPQDRIEGWTSDTETCSFKIQNLARIGMALDHEAGNDSLIVMNSHGKNPFPFKLTVHLQEAGDSTNVNLVFDGEMNAMLLMMAKTPLTNFFNMLADGLVKTYA